jgi:hypothetical protein
MPGPWPDEALLARASEIGTAVLELLAQQERWIHRRLERIEIVSATQFTRSVAADLTVPVALAEQLELQPDPSAHPPGHPAPATDHVRFVIPLGSIPKGPLVDFTLAPDTATRLTALQTNVLLLSAIAPYARAARVPEGLLALASAIILSEKPADAQLAAADALLDAATGDRAALEFVRNTLKEFNAKYALLVAVDAVPGLPLRVTYGHRDYYPRTSHAPEAPPLVIEAPLVHASGPGPPYRLELVAPDGLEIESASLARQAGGRSTAIESVNTEPGAGAFVQLRAPDSADRPDRTTLIASLGWLTGGIHQLAAVTGVLSTLSLAVASTLSFVLGTGLGGGAADALFAAPALVTTLVLGFATTRITSPAANLMRVATLSVALFGVAGTLVVSVLGGQQAHLHELRALLIAASVPSALVTCAWPLPAALRSRSKVDLQ